MKAFPFVITIFATVALLFGGAHATAIGVIRTPSALVIAADGGLLNRPDEYCKVRQFGKLTFAVSGWAFNETDGYDVFKSIAKVPESEQLNRIETLIIRDLAPALERQRVKDLTQYRFLVRTGDVLKVIVLEFFTEPKMAIITFSPTNTEIDPVSLRAAIEECPGEGCPDGKMFEVFGPVDTQTFRITGYRWDEQPTRAVGEWIQHEIDSKHPHVSPPRTIVEIQKGNILNWVERGACKQHPKTQLE